MVWILRLRSATAVSGNVDVLQLDDLAEPPCDIQPASGPVGSIGQEVPEVDSIGGPVRDGQVRRGASRPSDGLLPRSRVAHSVHAGRGVREQPPIPRGSRVCSPDSLCADAVLLGPRLPKDPEG